MIVQGLWEFKSPFLQLPHIDEDNIKYFMSKKRPIKSLQQFAQMSGEDRRNVLRSLSEEEYDNVMKVLGSMPYVDFQVKHEVVDDENPTEVTAGAIVTVTVTLIRKDMNEIFGDYTVKEAANIDNSVEQEGGDGEPEVQVNKKPAWMKQKKGGGKKANKKSNKQKTTVQVKSKAEDSPVPAAKTKSKEEKPGSQKDKESNTHDEESEDSDVSDEEINDNERSSEEEVKNSSVEDDDQVRCCCVKITI